MLQDDSNLFTSGSGPSDGDFADQYDEAWKLGLDSFLPYIMRLLFPAAFAEIDWRRGFQPLNTELQAILALLQNGDGAGKRHADALYKVWRLDGREQWIVLHFEVQSQPDPNLSRRMFTYLYRCFERYDAEIFGFAILGDRSPGFRPQPFHWQLGKATLSYEFECAKLLDFSIEELEASDNPAALILLAHHFTWSTKYEQTHRRRFKVHLTRLLFRKGYSAKEVDGLFKVLDWMMRLGREQAIIFTQEVLSLCEEPDMSAYVNTFEWVFTEQGIEKGKELGLREGIEKGIEKGSERLLRSLLSRRFGELPTWVTARLADADADTLERWSLKVLDAQRLEEVFA